jgi:hypothetical protein
VVARAKVEQERDKEGRPRENLEMPLLSEVTEIVSREAELSTKTLTKSDDYLSIGPSSDLGKVFVTFNSVSADGPEANERLTLDHQVEHRVGLSQ